VSRPGYRATAAGDLADELDRVAARYRDLEHALAGNSDLARDRDLYRDLAHDLARDLGRLDPGHALARALAFDLALDLDRARDSDVSSFLNGASYLDRDRALTTGLDRARDRARELHSHLAGRAAAVRGGWLATSVLGADHQQSSLTRRDDRVAARVLGGLALALPAAERPRFVAEERGNLADCERWWQRVDRLTLLAIEIPRLAWTLRRETWRGQA
jgi:hypothetical protein